METVNKGDCTGGNEASSVNSDNGHAFDTDSEASEFGGINNAPDIRCMILIPEGACHVAMKVKQLSGASIPAVWYPQ